MITFCIGLAVGASFTLITMYTLNALTLAHPDYAMCMTCGKTYNTRKRTGDCPHRKKGDRR